MVEMKEEVETETTEKVETETTEEEATEMTEEEETVMVIVTVTYEEEDPIQLTVASTATNRDIGTCDYK